jgi:hypothetical protein
MGEPRQAFLRISEIVSIIDVAEDNVAVKMKDGREFSVVANCAAECWSNIMEVVDPDLDDGSVTPNCDPFIQFSLRPN